MLRDLGLRQIEQLASGWRDYGFGPAEFAQWLSAGVAADEPHIAAALCAAEWTPSQAARQVAAGKQSTIVDAVRQHPDSVRRARELRRMAS
ncbi:MAG: hypothetical protein ACOH1Y_17750 [Propionicimonas sp.]